MKQKKMIVLMGLWILSVTAFFGCGKEKAGTLDRVVQ